MRAYPSFLIYMKGNEFRWRYEAAGGIAILDSPSGYQSVADCERSIELLKQCANSEVWETQAVTRSRR